jgi:hypothetical protein
LILIKLQILLCIVLAEKSSHNPEEKRMVLKREAGLTVS